MLRQGTFVSYKNKMNIGEKIIKLRKQNNMSQEELASKLNVSRQSISKWELNSATPDAYNLLELSKLFNVTTDYLLYDDYKSDEDIPKIKKVINDIKINKEKEIKNTLIQAILWLVAALCFKIAIYFNIVYPWLLHLNIILCIILSIANFYKYYKLRKDIYQSIDILLMLTFGIITILITYSLNRFTYIEIAFFAIASMILALLIYRIIISIINIIKNHH